MLTSIRNRDVHWRQRAACRGADPAQFDDTEKALWPRQAAVEAAHDFCHSCPVQANCRRAATTGPIAGTGVWGGQWRHRPGGADSGRPIVVIDLLGPDLAPRFDPPDGLAGRRADVWRALPAEGFTTVARVCDELGIDQRHASQVLRALAAVGLAWSPVRGVWRRADPADAAADEDAQVAS